MHQLSPANQLADTQSLLDSQDGRHTASRRTALKAALGVGYAASVGEAIAQTAIKTPSDGLSVGEVVVNVDGFQVPAYIARPAGKTNLPVVLVVQEIFGVHEYIADTARRFAKMGYLAIAPELYARQGDPTKYNSVPELVSDLVNKVPDAQVMADLDGMVKWAGANGGVLAFLILLLVGATASNFFGLENWSTGGMRCCTGSRCPVDLFGPSKQVSDTLFSENGNAFRKAVLIQWPREGIWTIAFVTGVPAGDTANHLVGEYLSVYVPTTPNPTGGYFVMLPKKDCIELRISVDEALKYIVSMGVVVPVNGAHPPRV